MSTVDIPEHVTRVAWRAFVTTHAQTCDLPAALADALTAAAPLLIAAELRKMADELYDGPQRWPASKVALIRARADELDPDGVRS